MNNTTTSNCPSLQDFDYKEEEEEVRAQALKEQVRELQMELSERKRLENLKEQINFWRKNVEADMKRLYDHFANENLITEISAQDCEKEEFALMKVTKQDITLSHFLEMKEELNTLKEMSHENKKQIKELQVEFENIRKDKIELEKSNGFLVKKNKKLKRKRSKQKEEEPDPVQQNPTQTLKLNALIAHLNTEINSSRTPNALSKKGCCDFINTAVELFFKDEGIEKMRGPSKGRKKKGVD